MFDLIEIERFNIVQNLVYEEIKASTNFINNYDIGNFSILVSLTK